MEYALSLFVFTCLPWVQAHTIPATSFGDGNLYVAVAIFDVIAFVLLTYLVQSKLTWLFDHVVVRTAVSAFIVYNISYLLIVGFPEQ